MSGDDRPSLPPVYFERLYREDPDPWGFETRPYEAAKYAATLAALPRARYARAVEIGCSIGVLTEMLAARCDRLLAIDVSDAALARARARCRRHLDRVVFRRAAVPDGFPGGPFDLILLSEVGYYLSRRDLARTRRAVAGQLEPGGHLLLVHWTPVVEGYPLTGDEVHEAFIGEGPPALRRLAGARRPTYRLDLFERTAAPTPWPG